MNTATNKQGKRELSGPRDVKNEDNKYCAPARSIFKKKKLNRSGKPEDAVYLLMSSESVTSKPSLDAGLPSEMWATVMECLPYSTVKQVAATNKFFLTEVISKITCIHLFDHRDMTESHAHRCVLVQKVNLYCLYKQNEYNLQASTKIVPFLSLFKNVVCISLGSMMYKQVNAFQSISTTLWNGVDNLGHNCGLYNHPGIVMMKHSPTLQHEQAKVAYHQLLHSFYGAVAVGALRQGLEVSGLILQHDNKNDFCNERARGPFDGNCNFRQTCTVCESLAGMLKFTAGTKSEGAALAHVVRDALKTGKGGGQHDLCLEQETGATDGHQTHLEDMGRHWEICYTSRRGVIDLHQMSHQEQIMIEEDSAPEIIHVVDSDEEY
jgi:hypothetical protein